MQLEQAAVMRKEAAADLEAAQMMKQRAVGGSGGGGPGGAEPAGPLSSGLKAAFAGRSLRSVLGLPGANQVSRANLL